MLYTARQPNRIFNAVRPRNRNVEYDMSVAVAGIVAMPVGDGFGALTLEVIEETAAATAWFVGAPAVYVYRHALPEDVVLAPAFCSLSALI